MQTFHMLYSSAGFTELFIARLYIWVYWLGCKNILDNSEVPHWGRGGGGGVTYNLPCECINRL